MWWFSIFFSIFFISFVLLQNLLITPYDYSDYSDTIWINQIWLTAMEHHIDSSNLTLRDPTHARVRFETHHPIWSHPSDALWRSQFLGITGLQLLIDKLFDRTTSRTWFLIRCEISMAYACMCLFMGDLVLSSFIISVWLVL